MRQRVSIQSASVAKNSYGESIQTWTETAEVWAAVEPLEGREYFQAQQVQAETSIRVRVRYLSGVVPTMRIIYGARTLEVLAVIDRDEQHKELHLMCRELV